MTGPDYRKHLVGLAGAAGKAIAQMPDARPLVERLRAANSRESFVGFLREVDMGVDEPARRALLEAAADEARWRDMHAIVVRSAEQQVEERYSPGS